MKKYAIIALKTCGSVISSVIVSCCLCKMTGRKRKQTTRPASKVNVTTTSVPQQVHHDVDKGQSITKSSGRGTKDGGMVFLAGAEAAIATGAEAAIATAAVVASVNDGGGCRGRGSNSSSDGGGRGGAGCGGVCGGGGCGGD